VNDVARRAQAKYEKSAKGIATRRKYEASAKGKAVAKRYRESAKGRRVHAKYDRSAKGKARSQSYSQRRIFLGRDKLAVAPTLKQKREIQAHIRKRLDEHQQRFARSQKAEGVAAGAI
jgi:hypothetical protein